MVLQKGRNGGGRFSILDSVILVPVEGGRSLSRPLGGGGVLEVDGGSGTSKSVRSPLTIPLVVLLGILDVVYGPYRVPCWKFSYESTVLRISRCGLWHLTSGTFTFFFTSFVNSRPIVTDRPNTPPK